MIKMFLRPFLVLPIPFVEQSSLASLNLSRNANQHSSTSPPLTQYPSTVSQIMNQIYFACKQYIRELTWIFSSQIISLKMYFSLQKIFWAHCIEACNSTVFTYKVLFSNNVSINATNQSKFSDLCGWELVCIRLEWEFQFCVF